MSENSPGVTTLVASRHRSRTTVKNATESCTEVEDHSYSQSPVNTSLPAWEQVARELEIDDPAAAYAEFLESLAQGSEDEDSNFEELSQFSEALYTFDDQKETIEASDTLDYRKLIRELKGQKK